MTAALLTTATGGYAGAGIATDGRAGPAATIAAANAGPGTFRVPQGLGSVAGSNLFHSFSRFNIDSGQTARFETNTAAIANVISRVTGGTASEIFGRLQLASPAGSTPAFFFINPAGVVFGAGATINVPGAFHVSTADYIKFANGDKFYADPANGSTLSSAAPEAFGFLGASRASISVTDGTWVRTGLSQTISLVAGEIDISNYGSVFAFGGDIRVVALGQAAQEIGLTGSLPATSGRLSILNGGSIYSYNYGAIGGGAIAVSAGNITIDSQASHSDTGIFSLAFGGAGNAGPVNVRAATLTVDGQRSVGYSTGISSQVWDGNGHAGSVEVSTTGNLSLVNGGQISADTFAAGNAGKVTVRAGSIAIDGRDSIRSSNFGYGTTGITSNAYRGSSGNAGEVDVSSDGQLDIRKGGRISAEAIFSGDAGPVSVRAGSVAIDGQGSDKPTGILSLISSGKAGSVEVSATGAIAMDKGGEISSATFFTGDAGAVTVHAASIVIGSSENANPTGITSLTTDSSGKAGNVKVTATGNLSMLRGGAIASDTRSTGNAGNVKVSAGNIAIDGKGATLTGIRSLAMPSATGSAGRIEVATPGNLSLVHGGEIISDSFSPSSNAGAVKVSAGSIAIDSLGESNATGIFSQTHVGTGSGGSIDVAVAGRLAIDNGGLISTSTNSAGNAGTIKVSAGEIAIDRRQSSTAPGIVSQSFGSSGDAGSVEVVAAGSLSLSHGAGITASSRSSGDAGSVTVRAGSLRVDGVGPYGDSSKISATAGEGSSGQTGSVSVTANEMTISNGGQISIENRATVADPSVLTPTAISVTAPTITIVNSPAAISSTSTGNVTAGAIRIVASDTLRLDPSGITTTANLGNGGAIDIITGLFWLENSQIATSVRGLSGNGGNITISAESLIMNTGFIQANTAAPNASGGLVSITVDNLIASGGSLFLGDNTPYTYRPGVFGFNVIQAAAPTGVNGVVQISSPRLDITSSLVGFDTRLLNAQVARRLCGNSGGSSLVPVGRGGLPLVGADYLSPGQVSGLDFIASPVASLPAVRTSWRTDAFAPCLASL
ncbi:MAG: filamentous hemagglutinin N-terminal domain-containing protein [Candidatus Accumulibacter sp.]|uniref:beta strand repeat-containing protein n=1 Tax=Accumulibacter sp. TaxID=2053492 RepID=UPI001AC8AD32|nr:filamentous hemagglutinin N-terminal domain-containing protein [Accumulibacter sp.]MBN8438601.1 filamentous hemagglutinin N-terminal domain-containing protein [Accumulibacter sp.]